MDIHPNVSVATGFSDPWDFTADSNKDGNENDDYSTLEWLSIYVEDCLSSGTTTYCTQPQTSPKTESVPVNPEPISAQKSNPPSQKSKKSNPPSKSEFRRRRGSIVLSEEPPLVHNQTEWLADSEPMYPLSQPKPDTPNPPPKKKLKVPNKVTKEEKAQRRCTHCLSNKTPQWREGPMGPKTLCNACGVRFKSGRLLPEYRPAKSPTFVSWMHSNSHKKVLEMRKANVPSNSD